MSDGDAGSAYPPVLEEPVPPGTTLEAGPEPVAEPEAAPPRPWPGGLSASNERPRDDDDAYRVQDESAEVQRSPTPANASELQGDSPRAVSEAPDPAGGGSPPEPLETAIIGPQARSEPREPQGGGAQPLGERPGPRGHAPSAQATEAYGDDLVAEDAASDGHEWAGDNLARPGEIAATGREASGRGQRSTGVGTEPEGASLIAGPAARNAGDQVFSPASAATPPHTEVPDRADPAAVGERSDASTSAAGSDAPIGPAPGREAGLSAEAASRLRSVGQPPAGAEAHGGQNGALDSDLRQRDAPDQAETADATPVPDERRASADRARLQAPPPAAASGADVLRLEPSAPRAASVGADEPLAQAEPASPAAPGPRPQRGLPRAVAVANQKGGVGKTTTAVNLGAALADLGYRVLVVDLDPQGNATTGLGINPRNLAGSVYDVLMSDAPMEDCVEPTAVRNLFVVPATIDLAGAEIELVPAFSRELKLRRAVDRLGGEFDFTLIDCPPSLGLLTVNGLAAADEVLVPIQCEYYALEGLGQLMKNIQLVQSNLNPRLELSTIVLTMFDARTRLADQVAREVRAHFGTKVCRTIVPRTVRLSEAPSFGQPINVFDPTSRGAVAYRELAREVSGGATRRAG